MGWLVVLSGRIGPALLQPRSTGLLVLAPSGMWRSACRCQNDSNRPGIGYWAQLGRVIRTDCQRVMLSVPSALGADRQRCCRAQ